MQEINSGNEKVFQGYTERPTSDEVAILPGGDTAIAFGKSVPHYKWLGLEFDLENRWTATLLKADDQVEDRHLPCLGQHCRQPVAYSGQELRLLGCRNLTRHRTVGGCCGNEADAEQTRARGLIMGVQLKHRWSISHNYLAGITAGDWWRLLSRKPICGRPSVLASGSLHHADKSGEFLLPTKRATAVRRRNRAGSNHETAVVYSWALEKRNDAASLSVCPGHISVHVCQYLPGRQSSHVSNDGRS